MELLPDLYCFLWQGQGNNCNSYAIRYHVGGEPRIALFDPGQYTVPTPMVDRRTGRMVGMGQAPGLDLLVSQLERDGLSPAQVSLVLHTHCHPDHCQSGPWWRQHHGALIGLHEAERDNYLKTTQANGVQSGPADTAETNPEPDLFLQEGELRLGDQGAHLLQVLHTPGHARGSVCFYWPERKAAIVGDVVFYRSVGRTDLPGGDARLLKQSIQRLSELEIDYLLTGHPYGHPGLIAGRREVEQNFRLILSSGMF